MSVVDDILTMDSAESRCSINGDTRDIVVPDEYHIFGVESDENVTRIPFICPKIVGDNVDLTGYSLYINYINGVGLGGIYVVDDVVTSGDNITFSWLLSRNVTAKAGTVSYIICAKKSGTDAKVTNEWNTKIATGIVSSGIETYDTVVQQSSDVINKLLKLTQGQSAYDIAIDNGFVGTKAEWLESLKGAEGAPVNWRGVWGENTEYSKLDAVSYDGSSYIFTSDTHVVGSIPGIDEEWGLMTQKGNDGANGVTPHIGDNGNWYLGATDTGKPSRGKNGAKGAAGKSAYQYAQDGGYTGTEAEFAEKLAQDFPASVTAEAKRVAQNVQGVRTGKSLTFVACSDVHLNISEAKKGGATLYAATLKSLKMAGQGVRALRNVMPLDAAVVLGDFTWADASYTVAKCKGDFTECIQNFSEAMSGIPSAWLVGNHDINYGASRDRTLTEDEIYAYIGANSTGVTSDPDHQEKNYYYKDFDGQKIRMIFLNTCDALTEYTPTAGSKAKSEWMSAVQLQWLADTALDFSDKADASQWGVVVCSHHPVDYGDAMKRACMILEAYKAGTSGSISYTDANGGSQSIAYNFTAGEKAEIICNIHGHSHNFGYKKISSSNSVTPWLWRVCIPCINCGRENEQATNADLAGKYGEFDADGNPVYYRKAEWSDAISGWVYNAEKGTSFCVVTIDRKTKKIYAHYFGVGRDRTIEYGESTEEPETPSYTNLVPTSEAMDSTAVYNGGLGYRDGYYISSGSGGDSAKSGHATTGMIAYPNVAGGKIPPTIYLKGGTISRIGLYYSDKSFKMTLTSNGFTTVHFTSEQLGTGYYKLTPVMLTDGSNNSSLYNAFGNIRYLRFDVECTTGADLIITLDEPIV